mmetsp:Transcript_6659/g.17298  ORF Transcript_6659/g.17298 Transcript_6659/m.17298 type:complete len:215 (+) Transcript_6659:498-1142(+)
MARIRLRRHHWGVPASTRGCLSASPAALRPPRWQRTPSFWRQRQCPLLDSTVVGKPVHGLLNVHRQPQPPLLDVSNRMTACTRLLACADCLDTCAVYRGVVRVTPHGLLELRQQIRLPCHHLICAVNCHGANGCACLQQNIRPVAMLPKRLLDVHHHPDLPRPLKVGSVSQCNAVGGSASRLLDGCVVRVAAHLPLGVLQHPQLPHALLADLCC